MAQAKTPHCRGPVKWNVVSPAGPDMAFHVGCIVGSAYYIHGGIEKNGSTTAVNSFYRMDFGSGIWNQVFESGSPALSHHAAVVRDNRYIIIIGGWNGTKRSSNVFVFDTKERKWIPSKTKGFSVDGGLSSHTATLGENGDILVVGREGSLRTQRKTGNAYLLEWDKKNSEFTYTNFPIKVASRSGHSAHIISNALVVYGGRDDKGFELHGGFKTGEYNSEVMEQLVAVSREMLPLEKPPYGRKHHVSASGAGAIFIHGGESFDGRVRGAIGETFLLRIKPRLAWYNFGTYLPRTGHAVCTNGERVLIHGGICDRNIMHGDTYDIGIKKEEIKS